MERRPRERDLEIPNSLDYSPPIIQESPLKLPLAPILSDRRGNSAVSGRRGSSIFSPVETLDPPEDPAPHYHRQLSPSPQQQREPTPDSPPPPPRPPPVASDANASIIYRECLKNHAASMGGHVVDGCGEFMPGGDEGTPESLRCAACGCHRSFHRKEVDGRPHYPHHHGYHQRSTPFLQGGQATYSLPPPPPQQQQHQRHHHKHSQGFAAAPSTMFNFGGGGPAAESSSEDLNMFGGQAAISLQPSRSGKRFRTKFSQDQKDRMHEFASRIGWRILKQDEEEVQRFCSEVGVKRQVFKVWMHNNKQGMKRTQN